MSDKLKEIFSKPSFYLPTIIWGGFVLIMNLLMIFGSGKYTSLLRTLIQWDGQHYLSIARDGYEKFPCGFNSGFICGNVGWFPLYPIISKITSLGFIDIRTALLQTSWITLWLAMLLLYRLVALRFDSKTALFSLLALVLFPGSFYFLAGFPYSLFILLTVIVFYLLEKKQYRWIALPCGLLAVTYPSGILIGLPLLWELFVRYKELDKKQRLGLITGIIAIGMCLFLFASYFWFRFDDFWLYNRFQGQSYYAHEIKFPLVTIFESFKMIQVSDPVNIMIIFLIAAIAVLYSKKIPIGWQLFMFGILLFTPTFGTTTCYYRQIVVAIPMFVMFAVASQRKAGKYLFYLYSLVSVYLLYTVYLQMYKDGLLM